jgi:hypothetical protein
VLWVCRLGVSGDEARVSELEGLPKRLALWWWWWGWVGGVGVGVGGWGGGGGTLKAGVGWEWGLE